MPKVTIRLAKIALTTLESNGGQVEIPAITTCPNYWTKLPEDFKSMICILNQIMQFKYEIPFFQLVCVKDTCCVIERTLII